ncbi:MAG: MATE family efflux transporter [Rubrivivax sp.]
MRPDPGAASANASSHAQGGFAADAGRITRLAWPVFIGQISVLAFSTVDTLLVARYSAQDLAALAVGAAAYVTVFIGFMGVVLAISPIVGQLQGAGRLHDAGRQVHQAIWVALALALLGALLLAFPWPFLALAKATPELEAKVRPYLLALACALPASLLFTVYRGFNNAVSRPKAVMLLQVAGLGIKVPCSAALVWGVPALGVPSLGVVGCGIATAIAMWAQVIAAIVVLRRDRFYERYAIWTHGLEPPRKEALRKQLSLGVPMGLSILVEVTSFSMMAIFIARLGTTAVAGHQIVANLVALLFMMPLAVGNATSTLVAQRIGAQDMPDARRLGWHGMQLGLVLACGMGLAMLVSRESVVRLYTQDAAVVAVALPLVAWLLVFHVGDAVQAIAAFILRAHHVARLPLVILALSLWGVGLGGGYLLAFNVTGLSPASLQGPDGFWAAAAWSLVLAAIALTACLAYYLRNQVPGSGGLR